MWLLVNACLLEDLSLQFAIWYEFASLQDFLIDSVLHELLLQWCLCLCLLSEVCVNPPVVPHGNVVIHHNPYYSMAKGSQLDIVCDRGYFYLNKLQVQFLLLPILSVQSCMSHSCLLFFFRNVDCFGVIIISLIINWMEELLNRKMVYPFFVAWIETQIIYFGAS